LQNMQPKVLAAAEIVIGGAAGLGTMLTLDRQLRGTAFDVIRRIGWSPALSK
jgi:hypothetical protein